MASDELMAKDCFARHVGVELLECGGGSACVRLRILPHHLNGLGIVQGGVVFTLADFAFAAASNSRGAVAVALDTHLSFLKAARDGTLTARCREVGLNRRTAFYAVDVTDDAGALVAVFQGTAYRKTDAVPPA